MSPLLRRTSFTVASTVLLLCAGASSGLAGGFLWISCEFAADPSPIHRYDISTGLIDMTPVPGIPGDVCNNLATDGTTLYLGTDDDIHFWKADPITGVPFSFGSYVPPLAAASLEDGDYRASNGHLYRTGIFNALHETDTDGGVIASYAVIDAPFTCGLEFIGDVLYCTTLDGGTFGSLTDLGGGIWGFTLIPLAGLPSGHLTGGLAYDEEDGILYMATTTLSEGFLWTVDPIGGTATLVHNLTTESGYPAGFILPDAMGWVKEEPVQNQSSTWGRVKGVYR